MKPPTFHTRKQRAIQHKAALFAVLIGALTAACGQAKTNPAEPFAPQSALDATAAPNSVRVRVSDSLKAVQKAKALTMTYSLLVENVMGEAADGTPSMLMSVAETQAGALSEVTSSYNINNASASQRYMIDGSKLYVKGPASALGAPDDAWYVASDEQAKALTPEPIPSIEMRKLLDKLLASPVDLDAQARPQGTDQTDGQTCTVYALDQTGTLAKKDVEETRSVFKSIDTAEFKLLICADGLPHVIRARYVGTGRGSAAKPASAQVEFTMKGFDATTALVAPPDAKPLLAPGEGAIRAPKEESTAVVAAARAKASAATDTSAMIAPTSTSAAAGATDLTAATVATDTIAIPAANAAAATSSATDVAGATDATSADASTAALTNSNDGSYDTDFPLVGKIKDLVKLDGEDMVNYETNIPMQQVYDFYKSELKTLGLSEVPDLTVFSDTTFSSVFSGLPDGRKLVVQVVINGPGSTNVNVSKRKI